MPNIVRGFTNAAAMMIAEKGSDLIKETYLPELKVQENFKLYVNSKSESIDQIQSKQRQIHGEL